MWYHWNQEIPQYHHPKSEMSLPIYVIRNTTEGCPNNSHNIFVLLQAVSKFVLKECEIVIVNADEQSIDTEYEIINLDPFSRKENHFVLDICRQFSEDQSSPIGFRSRTNVSIKDQIASIPNGKYIIVDDDIASGATKRYVESITSHLDIVDYVSLLRVWCDTNGYKDREIFDCIDTHDFWGNLPDRKSVV